MITFKYTSFRSVKKILPSCKRYILHIKGTKDGFQSYPLVNQYSEKERFGAYPLSSAKTMGQVFGDLEGFVCLFLVVLASILRGLGI